jgi:hypothetical protein
MARSIPNHHSPPPLVEAQEEVLHMMVAAFNEELKEQFSAF